jgi:hypothetical protein
MNKLRVRNRDNTISITLHNFHKKGQRYLFSTSCELFKHPVVIKVDKDKITFRKAGIDDNKTHNFKQPSGGHKQYRAVIVFNDLPQGEFEFDNDESNDDFKIAYFYDN